MLYLFIICIFLVFVVLYQQKEYLKVLKDVQELKKAKTLADFKSEKRQDLFQKREIEKEKEGSRVKSEYKRAVDKSGANSLIDGVDFIS